MLIAQTGWRFQHQLVILLLQEAKKPLDTVIEAWDSIAPMLYIDDNIFPGSVKKRNAEECARCLENLQAS